MKRVKYWFITFMLLLSIFPAYEANAAEPGPQMKVKLKNYLGNQSSITLTSNGEYQLADGRIFIKNGEEIQVKVKSGKLVIFKGSNEIGTYDTFSIAPVDSASLLYLNNRAYHGSFQFTVESGKYVRPINSLYIEDYLKGVVPREMPALWHIEALKAQTIAARTYALRNQNRVIDDTVSYQVYGGAEGHSNSDKAVSETTGIVLKYNNNVIDAVFSSSNGGVTELNSNAWSTSVKLPYFAIQEDPYDPKTAWSIVLDKQQIDLIGKNLSKPEEWWTSVKEKDSTIVPNIKNWLKNNGYPNKDIKITAIPILSLGEKSSGGRVTKGSIQVNFYVKDLVDEQGALKPQTVQYTNVTASKIRAMVGLDKMKSYLVDESISTADTISIKGRGNGHGVGLSQYGAKKRAEAGQTYNTILQFYYPGTTLEKAYSEVVQDTGAPKITSVTSTTDYSKSMVNIAYTLDEESTVTVAIENQEGKVVATPVNGVKVASGNQSTNWDIKNITDGTYSVSITATDSSSNTNTVNSTISIKKVATEAAVNISNVTAKANYSTETATIGYKISEDAKVTVSVKNSQGKLVATPVKERQFVMGSRSTTWNFGKNSDGTYKVTITAIDDNHLTNTVTQTLKIKRTKGKVIATSLNIRAKKSTSSKIVGKLKKNQTVTILAKEASWYKIKTNTTTGYIAAKYIKIK